MTQLRFEVGCGCRSDIPSEKLLQTIWCDLGSLSVAQRELLNSRRSGQDIYELQWSTLVGGERIGQSRLEISPKRVRADSATLPSLMEAVEANEAAVRSVPVRVVPMGRPLAYI